MIEKYSMGARLFVETLFVGIPFRQTDSSSNRLFVEYDNWSKNLPRYDTSSKKKIDEMSHFFSIIFSS